MPCLADVTIGFERDHYSVREEDKTLEVCAAVTKGELSGATEVQLTVDTLSSDATVSSDATALQGTIKHTIHVNQWTR